MTHAMKWKIFLFSFLFVLLMIPSATILAVYADDPIYGRLEQPVLSLNDSIVSWNPVSEAKAYYFYFTLGGSPALFPDESSRLLIGNDNTSIDIQDYTEGGTRLNALNYNYGISVTALYGLTVNEFPTNNSYPAHISFVIRQLAQPAVTVAGRFAHWNAVENAMSYSVYATKGTGVDQITSQTLTTTELKMDIKELFDDLQDDDYEVGDEFTFHVKALHGTQYLYTSSEEKTADGTVKAINLAADTVCRKGGFEIVWSAVPDATSYRITFYGIANNSGITRTTTSADFDLLSSIFIATGFEHNKEYTVAVTPISTIGFFAEGETVTIPWSVTKNDNTWIYIVMGVGLGFAAIYGLLVWYGNKKKIRTHVER